MISKIAWLLLLLTATMMTSCQKGDSGAAVEAKIIRMPEMSKEIKLPTKLWDLVTGASFEKSVQQSANFIFSPITVQMKEKNPGVLTDPLIRIEFPNAGGEIDFSKYVKADRGTFQISFDFVGLAEGDSLQVYYVSKARKRKLDGELYGSGCKNFFAVKDYISKVNAKEGLVVNVTRDRHDSAVGGHFIFSYKKDKQTYISQVSFTDSKRPDLFCEANER